MIGIHVFPHLFGSLEDARFDFFVNFSLANTLEYDETQSSGIPRMTILMVSVVWVSQIYIFAFGALRKVVAVCEVKIVMLFSDHEVLRHDVAVDYLETLIFLEG